MIVATMTTVRLDPVQEHEVIQQYVWPTYHVEAKYMPVDREVMQ